MAVCTLRKNSGGSRGAVPPGRAFRPLRACAIMFLILLLSCQPAVAASTISSVNPALDSTTFSAYSLDSEDGISAQATSTLATQFIYNFKIGLYDSKLQRTVYSFYGDRRGSITTKYSWSTPRAIGQFWDGGYTMRYYTSDHDFNIDNYNFDTYVISYIFRGSDDYSYLRLVNSLVKFGYLYISYNVGGNGVSFYTSDINKVTYQVYYGPYEDGWDGSFPSTEVELQKSVFSGSSYPFWSTSNVNFSGIISFSNYLSTTNLPYGFMVNIYVPKSAWNVDSSTMSNTSAFFSAGFANSSSNSCYLSFSPQSTPTVGQQNSTIISGLDELNSAVQQTTSAVQQVNQSMQSLISDVQGLSAQMGQMSQAIQQMTSEITSKLEQSTQLLNSYINAQTQALREALGLVSDNITGSIDIVNTTISNQTTQITGKIDSLQQNVTNKLDTVNNSISSGFEKTEQQLYKANDYLEDMPNQIGNKITELMVPSAEDITNQYEPFRQLLEEKLGIIYQVPAMVFDFVKTIANGVTNSKDTITLPAFSLPWIDGSSLTLWEEIEFKVIPEGMEILSDAVKTFTSFACVANMFNAILRRYEEFLGMNKEG